MSSMRSGGICIWPVRSFTSLSSLMRSSWKFVLSSPRRAALLRRATSLLFNTIELMGDKTWGRREKLLPDNATTCFSCQWDGRVNRLPFQQPAMEVFRYPGRFCADGPEPEGKHRIGDRAMQRPCLEKPPEIPRDRARNAVPMGKVQARVAKVLNHGAVLQIGILPRFPAGSLSRDMLHRGTGNKNALVPVRDPQAELQVLPAHPVIAAMEPHRGNRALR